MSLNYAFGFSVILLLLVAVNIYFFYSFTAISKPHSLPFPGKLDIKQDTIFKEIYDHFNYLPSHYKAKNPKYLPVQRSLLQSFELPIVTNTKSLWQDAVNVSRDFCYSFHVNNFIINQQNKVIPKKTTIIGIFWLLED